MNALDKLEELTERLIPNLQALTKNRNGQFIEWETYGGFCNGVGLDKEDSHAVVKAYAAGGTVFPSHTHDAVEVLVFVTGKGVAHLEGEGSREFRAPYMLWIEPGVEHSVEFLESTKLIAITIPASDGYPDGPG